MSLETECKDLIPNLLNTVRLLHKTSLQSLQKTSEQPQDETHGMSKRVMGPNGNTFDLFFFPDLFLPRDDLEISFRRLFRERGDGAADAPPGGWNVLGMKK